MTDSRQQFIQRLYIGYIEPKQISDSEYAKLLKNTNHNVCLYNKKNNVDLTSNNAAR